jgi:hypothetical protein
MNIIEPYVDFSFGANNNKVLEQEIPSWNAGIGCRYISIYKKIGLSFEWDLALSTSMIATEGKFGQSITSTECAFLLGYNLIYDKEDLFAMLSFSVGIGGFNGIYCFENTEAQNEFPSSVNAITHSVGYIPIKIKGVLDNASIAFTYRLPTRNVNSSTNDLKLKMPAFEVSIGMPLDFHKARR